MSTLLTKLKVIINIEYDILNYCSRIPEESLNESADLNPENILETTNVFHPLFLNNISEMQQNDSNSTQPELAFLVSL